MSGFRLDVGCPSGRGLAGSGDRLDGRVKRLEPVWTVPRHRHAVLACLPADPPPGAGRRRDPVLEPLVADVAFLALTLLCFVALAALVRGLERL